MLVAISARFISWLFRLVLPLSASCTLSPSLNSPYALPSSFFLSFSPFSFFKSARTKKHLATRLPPLLPPSPPRTHARCALADPFPRPENRPAAPAPRAAGGSAGRGWLGETPVHRCANDHLLVCKWLVFNGALNTPPPAQHDDGHVDRAIVQRDTRNDNHRRELLAWAQDVAATHHTFLHVVLRASVTIPKSHHPTGYPW